jgi:hypothetical protein
MPVAFETLTGFEATLREVDILLDTAEANEANETLYAALNKSAILLLTGKFEYFAEHLAEEYIFSVNNLKANADRIPDVLRLSHSLYALRVMEQFRDKRKKELAISVFVQLGKLWATSDRFEKLDVDCKFSYGKHGQVELRKLFGQIGIEDIFEIVKVREPDETLLAETEEKEVDFAGEFNSVTYLRNNILHQDASPQLTVKEIRRFVNLCRAFSSQLVRILVELLNDLERRATDPHAG